MAARTLDKARWPAYFDRLSKVLAGGPVEIEVESLELDDEIQADWVRLFGIVYETRKTTSWRLRSRVSII